MGFAGLSVTPATSTDARGIKVMGSYAGWHRCTACRRPITYYDAEGYPAGQMVIWCRSCLEKKAKNRKAYEKQRAKREAAKHPALQVVITEVMTEPAGADLETVVLEGEVV